MPRFHYGKSVDQPSTETDELANYFAARDRAEFPYQTIAEQTPSLSRRTQQGASELSRRRLADDDATRPRRASSAMRSASSSRAEAQKVVNGPDLREVAPRFRPDYLEAWIANPRRLVPYTAMPQNIVPHGTVQIPVPKTFENQPIEMVRAIRDTLLNYVNAVELQLAQSARGDADRSTPKAARIVALIRRLDGGHVGQLETEAGWISGLEFMPGERRNDDCWIRKPAMLGLSLGATLAAALAGCGGGPTNTE